MQVTGGTLLANGERLEVGDGASPQDGPGLTLSAETDAELLLFDLA